MTITSGQAAAKQSCREQGLSLAFYDYASLANAVYTVGPVGDYIWATRDYFRRNHREVELTDSQVAIIAKATYIGLHGKTPG